MSKLGILDLQGGVLEHLDHLDRLGIRAVRVKESADLRGLAGLIIPGGESTCLGRLLRIFKLDVAIREEFGRGLKLWGTCAGAILLAKHIEGETAHLGLIDIRIQRNAFGSQLDSFHTWADIPRVSPSPVPLIFIRAPKITAVGPGVEVLLRLHDYIAAAESSDVLVSVFHPELTPSLACHRYFAHKCGLPVAPAADPLAQEGPWDMTSWTCHARVPVSADLVVRP